MNAGQGTTLAHYRITAELGAGGMGEVWRAEDTKLGREVALKVLPEEFAKDPERMARFEREAKVLASLNHPNIATLFGLESAPVIPSEAPGRVEGSPEARSRNSSPQAPGNYSHPSGAVKHLRQREDHHVGTSPTSDPLQLPKAVSGDPSTPASPGDASAQDDSGSVTFLAMELVEGEDLSERIKRGAVPVEEATAIALQIAEALEAALELLAGIDIGPLDPHNTFHISESFAMAGDTGRALEVFESAVDQGFYPYPFFNEYCPFMAPLRSLPEFASILGEAKTKTEAFRENGPLRPSSTGTTGGAR
jgi:serine/threonine protein kinase